MKKFSKGYTYLVKVKGFWYVVQQQGQRSWEAIIFSHHVDVINGVPKHIHSTASGMCEEFKKLDVDAQFERVIGNSDMRKKMFRILQTGKIEGWEEL